MKLLERIQGLKIWALLLLASSTFVSCNILDEEEADCAVYVSFKYDMNIVGADAFSNSVKSVTLYAFGKDGKLAFQKTEEGSPLTQEGYAMRLDEISRSEVGDYDYITWAGLADNESFTVPLLQVGSSTKEDLYCRLNRKHVSRADNGSAVVDQNLESLFHGMVNGNSLSRAASSNENIEVSLTKNTNHIRIVLQHLSGEPVDVEKLNFSITDENGLMNYDNSLLEDEVITYQAWDKRSGYAGLGEEEIEGITSVNVAIADLTVARLMADERPILRITNENGENVVTIPLVDYALLVKSEYSKFPNMSDQEYLDRQDEYTMVFFLDEGNRWMSSYIYINSWKVVLNHYDF